MKTNEFIKKVEILGYEITKKQFLDGTNYFVIYNSFGGTMCYVAINKVFEVNIRPDENMSEELFDLVREYACTPVEDRKDEEKFYLKHRFVTSSESFPQKLVWHYKNKVYQLVNNGWDNICYQSQFTLKEIEEIKEKFDTDLSDFEMVEVEE